MIDNKTSGRSQSEIPRDRVRLLQPLTSNLQVVVFRVVHGRREHRFSPVEIPGPSVTVTESYPSRAVDLHSSPPNANDDQASLKKMRQPFAA